MNHSGYKPDDQQEVEASEESPLGHPNQLILSTAVQPTSAERFQMASRLKDHLLQEHNALQAYVVLKNVREVADHAMEALKDEAIGGITGKEEMVYGAKCAIRGLREYEYEDPTLAKIEEQMAGLKKQVSERKTFLRALKMEVADTSTGEIIRPAKCVKDGSTIAVTLPE